jgi:hypothetical protein
MSRCVGAINDLLFDEEVDEADRWAPSFVSEPDDDAPVGLAYSDLQPRDPAGASTGGQWTSQMPQHISQLTYVKELGGSTGAKLYEDESGKKYVVKKGKNWAHVKSEHEANELYRQLGVKVPRSKLDDASQSMITEFVEGKQLGETTGEVHENAVKQLRAKFAVDALLGNWDVVGAGGDNVVVDKDGIAWRIDNGGALAYRAQGAPKGSAWNAAVGEIDSMRAPSCPAGKVFGGVTNADVTKQVNHLAEKYGKVLLEHGDDVVFKRFTTLVQKYGGEAHVAEKAAEVPPPKASKAEIAAHKVYTDAASKANASWLGKDKHAALYNLKQKLSGSTLTDKDMKKMVMMAINMNDEGTLHVLSTFTPDELHAVKQAFPGKQLVKTVPAKVLEQQFAETGANTFPQLWQKAFNEPASQPLPHPVLKPVAKVPGVSKKEAAAETPFTTKELAIGGGVKTYVSKLYWEEYEKQYAKEYAHLDRPPLVSDSPLEVKTSEKGNGNYGKVVEEHLQKVPGAVGAAQSWGGSPTQIHQAELGHADSAPMYKKYAAAIQAAWKDPSVPKYEGIAYRGMHGVKPGTHSFEQLTTPGNVVEFNASQGASRKTDFSYVLQSFVMRCAVKTGVSIETMSGHSSEKELWLPKGTKWRVAGVAYNVKINDKVVQTVVDLEEIAP